MCHKKDPTTWGRIAATARILQQDFVRSICYLVLNQPWFPRSRFPRSRSRFQGGWPEGDEGVIGGLWRV